MQASSAGYQRGPDGAARLSIRYGMVPMTGGWDYPPFFEDTAHEPDTARRMIEEGADVNKVIENGHQSPLLWALEYEAFDIAKLLIEHGANVLHKNCLGETPLHLICAVSSNFRASEEDRYEMCKLLLDKGAECHSRSMDGVTPLLYALIQRSLPIIKLLLDHGADITALDTGARDYTALHWATYNQHVDVIEFVVDQGIDIRCRDKFGESPLHVAARNNNFKACEYFLKRGENVNKKSNKPAEFTPLSCTTLWGEYWLDKSEKAKTVQVLLEYGANVTDRVREVRVLDRLAQFGAWRDNEEFGVNLNPYTDVRYVLMRHVAKMEYTNLSIGEDYRQVIEDNQFYKCYYEFCIEELESMKRTKLHDDVSVFNILMDGDELISRYAENAEVVRALEARDYDNEFPIYFTWLKKKFYAEVDKRRL